MIESWETSKWLRKTLDDIDDTVECRCLMETELQLIFLVKALF